jgi:hypothetical protein
MDNVSIPNQTTLKVIPLLTLIMSLQEQRQLFPAKPL